MKPVQAVRTAPSVRVWVGEHAGPGSALVEAGGLLFTSSCDGNRPSIHQAADRAMAGEIDAQCEQSYASVLSLLAIAGADAGAVVRLDHFTESQAWLPRRAAIRARLFGRPAPLASTGVAAGLCGGNLLSTAAVALAGPERPVVRVAGDVYGMENIATAVAGGGLLFLSGMRGRTHPDWREAVDGDPATVQHQIHLCYQQILAVLEAVGVGRSGLLRVDGFLRRVEDQPLAQAACAAALGAPAGAVTTVALPLGGRGEVELTAVALLHGERRVLDAEGSVATGGGWLWVGACEAGSASAGLPDAMHDLHAALDLLAARLASGGATLAQVARLDVYLRDPAWVSLLREVVARRFPGAMPAVVVAGAASGQATVSLCAVAVASPGAPTPA